MQKWLIAACAVLLLSLVSTAAQAQYYGSPYAPRYGYGSAPYGSPYGYGPGYAPSYGYGSSYGYAPSTTYVMPYIWVPPAATTATRAPDPPRDEVPLSTYTVDGWITTCVRREGREECASVERLAPESIEQDRSLLIDIANVLRWGRGYRVTTTFIRHLDGTIAVGVVASPVHSGYRYESVIGSGPTSVDAMRDALARVTTSAIR